MKKPDGHNPSAFGDVNRELDQLPDSDLEQQGPTSDQGVSRRAVVAAAVMGTLGYTVGRLTGQLESDNNQSKIAAYEKLKEESEKAKRAYSQDIENTLPVIAALLNYGTSEERANPKSLPSAINWAVDTYREAGFKERFSGRLGILGDAYVHIASRLTGSTNGDNQEAKRMAFLAAYVLTRHNPLEDVSSAEKDDLKRELSNFDAFMAGFPAVTDDNKTEQKKIRVQRQMQVAILHLVTPQDFQFLIAVYQEQFPTDLQKEKEIGRLFGKAIDRMIQIINPQ